MTEQEKAEKMAEAKARIKEREEKVKNFLNCNIEMINLWLDCNCDVILKKTKNGYKLQYAPIREIAKLEE